MSGWGYSVDVKGWRNSGDLEVGGLFLMIWKVKSGCDDWDVGGSMWWLGVGCQCGV